MIAELQTIPLQVLRCALTFSVLLVSCNPREAQPPQDQTELIETGNSVSDALMKKLGTQLKTVLAAGNPAPAVRFCAQAATPLTEQTSTEIPNATVKRVSMKFRNPVNKPDAVDVEILSRWEKQLQEGKPLPAYELKFTNEQVTRFYRPIRVQKMCLTCHGDKTSFKPELLSVLSTTYPDDRATGYSEGDLRGAFRVEISQ
ncbi:MAG: DUF3365 domain-containing protein [Verrucomicrobiales bacterium]|nr:DUF3365 domain-containing protein [Verrucomicrobiales bacterium]